MTYEQAWIILKLAEVSPCQPVLSQAFRATRRTLELGLLTPIGPSFKHVMNCRNLSCLPCRQGARTQELDSQRALDKDLEDLVLSVGAYNKDVEALVLASI